MGKQVIGLSMTSKSQEGKEGDTVVTLCHFDTV